jgi:hypothetical protein
MPSVRLTRGVGDVRSAGRCVEATGSRLGRIAVYGKRVGVLRAPLACATADPSAESPILSVPLARRAASCARPKAVPPHLSSVRPVAATDWLASAF